MKWLVWQLPIVGTFTVRARAEVEPLPLGANLIGTYGTRAAAQSAAERYNREIAGGDPT